MTADDEARSDAAVDVEAGKVAALGEIPAGGGTTPAARPLIFISYRINPDEPVAVAVRRLIETSIEPSPEVYVSGAGGLRPSKIGFKPQLQSAVQRAAAFVGVITQASKEREWIFYEAGAAWGRGQIYVPLLIDTAPHDLTSSIADYQAIRASMQEEVSRLIDALAEAVGGQAKGYFSKRYLTFEKALSAYQGRDRTDEPQDESPRAEALRLLAQGKIDEGNAAFDALEASAASDDERASLRTDRLLAGKDTGIALLEKFEALGEPFKKTAEFHFWTGLLEPRPLASIGSLETAVTLATAGTFFHRASTVAVARANVDIGREAVALQILASAVRAADRQLRADAVERWLELFPKLSAEPKLLLLAFGMTGRRSPTFLEQRTELALNERWPALLARFARRYATEVDTPSSQNTLGRAYATLNLPSLAYRAYLQAAKGGVSVAKSNMAGLVHGEAVPAAGLEILDSHTGTFDSAVPAAPHRVRAIIEESIAAESKRAAEMSEAGNRIAQQLTLLAELALENSPETELKEGTLAAVGEAARKPAKTNALTALIEAKEEKLGVQRLLPGFNVWSLTDAGRTLGFFHAAEKGEFTGFRVDLSSDDGAVGPFAGTA